MRIRQKDKFTALFSQKDSPLIYSEWAAFIFRLICTVNAISLHLTDSLPVYEKSLRKVLIKEHVGSALNCKLTTGDKSKTAGNY